MSKLTLIILLLAQKSGLRYIPDKAMLILKIISGAQTGADRGGLDAAMLCSIPYGGWVPKGRRAEDGTIPENYAEMRETESSSYLVRTEANVVDSDATVVFSRGKLGGGSLKTAEFARKHNRPLLHVDLAMSGRTKAAEAVILWLRSACPGSCALNVAGQRESKAPGNGTLRAFIMNLGKAFSFNTQASGCWQVFSTNQPG